MKTDKLRRGFADELRSIGIYLAAVGFFASGYLCNMYGSGDFQPVLDLLAWYRTPISIAVIGLPVLFAGSKITEHILELRKMRMDKLENAEKNVSHQNALIETHKEKLTANVESVEELKSELERRQSTIVERELKLNAAENILRKSTTKYGHWAKQVASKVSKTSTTLIGDAGSQDSPQVAQLQQSSQEILRLLDKEPEIIGENHGEENENA